MELYTRNYFTDDMPAKSSTDKVQVAWSSLIIWDETSCLIYSIVSWPNFTFQISDISYIIKQWVDFLFLDEVFVNVAFQDDDKFTGWRT